VPVYDIRVAGQIDTPWSAWLDGLTITHRCPGEAVISGEIVDQTALHARPNPQPQPADHLDGPDRPCTRSIHTVGAAR